MSPMLSWIGWLATAAFCSSYLCRSEITLRRVQAGAAVLWVVYGGLIHALPVVVANLIVASVALYSSLARRPRDARRHPPAESPLPATPVHR